MTNYIFKCPFCDKRYCTSDKSKIHNAKTSLYEHMDDVHHDELNGKSPAQIYFNTKYNKDHGTCVMCGKETEWNESVERYNRFCSEKCKEKYRIQFKERMQKKYGKDTLLDDPEFQKKMLAGRKISGEYNWSDNTGSIEYTGSYEEDFLEFLDIVMHFDVKDVIGPAPQIFKYRYENKDHFYIPDFFIVSLNLIVEIKDGGQNPNMHHKIQDVDKKKEKIKDKVMVEQKEYNYIKVVDKDYSLFLNYLLELKYKD